MIEMLRIYSKGFLENVIIEELAPDPEIFPPPTGRVQVFDIDKNRE
jgi:hypothetical protein